MFLEKIVLHRYKNFTLHKNETFSTQLSNFVILNWRNGYGKSSLLSQLNLLPIEKKDFLEGGYKKLYLRCNDKNYILYSSADKHSLLEDNEELNVSYNKKTYLKLIENLFNITPEVIKYANGYRVLTDMSPNERKDVLFSISHLDYTYALGIYGKVCELHRDAIALLKYQSSNLNNINNICMNLEGEETLKRQKDELNKLKTFYLKSYYAIEKKDYERSLEEAYHSLIKDYEFIKSKPLEDMLNLENTLRDLQSNLLLKNKSKDEIEHNIYKLKTNIAQEDIRKVEEVIKTLQEEYKTLTSNLDNPYFIKIIEDGNLMSLKIIEEILYLLNLEEELLDLDISKIDLKLIEDLKEKIIQSKKAIEVYKNALNDFGNIEKVKCNNCGSLVNLVEKQENIKKLIKENESSLEENTKRLDIEIRNLKVKEKIDKFILDFNSKIVLLNETPISKIDRLDKQYYFNRYQHIYSIISKALEIKKSILIKEQEVSEMKSKSGMDRNELDKILKEYTNQVELLRNQIISLQENIRIVNHKLEEQKKLSTAKETLRMKFDSFKKLYEDNYRAYCNKVIDTIVEEIDKDLLEIEEKLRNYVKLISQRDALIEEIKRIELDVKDYKLLMQKLSPKSGLIAKSINSFLGVILEEMNAIIKQVWSYSFKLLPCEVGESGDLDFKFKVLVDDSRVVEDVSKLSASMKDIVNLAFRLIYIKYSKIGNIPLILDEFGNTMDKEHSSKAFDMIDEILRNSFEQIFLVSHFDSMYGRLKNVIYPNID